jgi:hypothetical protein
MTKQQSELIEEILNNFECIVMGEVVLTKYTREVQTKFNDEDYNSGAIAKSLSVVSDSTMNKLNLAIDFLRRFLSNPSVLESINANKDKVAEIENRVEEICKLRVSNINDKNLIDTDNLKEYSETLNNTLSQIESSCLIVFNKVMDIIFSIKKFKNTKIEITEMEQFIMDKYKDTFIYFIAHSISTSKIVNIIISGLLKEDSKDDGVPVTYLSLYNSILNGTHMDNIYHLMGLYATLFAHFNLEYINEVIMYGIGSSKKLFDDVPKPLINHIDDYDELGKVITHLQEVSMENNDKIRYLDEALINYFDLVDLNYTVD